MSDQKRFVVDTSKDGLDISGEEYRVYTFPDGSTVRVDYPAKLWVKVSNDNAMAGKHSHRIAKVNGNGVYIAAGWVMIEWQNKPGQPPVAW